MSNPTEKQIEYLTSLIQDLKMPMVHLASYDTFDKASLGIDRLQAELDKVTPIKDATRAAVFAKLRETSFTKEDMYAATGLETLSRRTEGTGATEANAKRCLRFLDGTLVKREPKPAQPEAELLGAVGEWLMSHEDEPEPPRSAPEPVPLAATPPVVLAAPAMPRRVISRPLPPVVPEYPPIFQGRIVPRAPRVFAYSKGFFEIFGRVEG